MSQIAAAGGQPQKSPRYAPIYTGRFFNGINTNRSPLRAASASHIYEKFYSDNSGDALIAGSNIEVSNRLTLVRRPGNPFYDTVHTTGNSNGYNDPWTFDEFRVGKAQSDVFGTTLEQIFTMVDESAGSTNGTGNLYSLTSGLVRGGDSAYHLGLKFPKSAGAGQTFMQPVGNSLYFADGVDNKKWLQSLFTRTTAGDNTYLQGANGLAGTYPFGTYLLDPATGNIQQFIGISIGSAAGTITVDDNILTLTVTFNSELTAQQAAGLAYPKGTTFQLWGFTTATVLNGLTITLLEATAVETASVTFTSTFDYANGGSVSWTESGPAYVLQTGTIGAGTLTATANAAAAPVVAVTGGSVPTWGTTVPQISNLFLGSLTADGNTIWINRGTTSSPNVYNWGIQAPTQAPDFTVSGSEVSRQNNTYYSAASIYLDSNSNLWQVTTAGLSGSSSPFVAPAINSPVPQQKVKVLATWVASPPVDGVATVFIKTAAQSPDVAIGDTVTFENLCVRTQLNGQTTTVVSTPTSTTFTISIPWTGGADTNAILDYGVAVDTTGASTLIDGKAVWTSIQLFTSLTWASGNFYNVGDFVLVPGFAGGSQFFQLGPLTVPFIHPLTTINIATITGSNSQQSADRGEFGAYNQKDTLQTNPIVYWNNPDSTAGNTFGPGNQVNYTLDSLFMQTSEGVNGGTAQTIPVNGAGEYNPSGASDIGSLTDHWIGCVQFFLFVPVAGAVPFTLLSDDGAFFAFDSTGVTTFLTGTSAIDGSTTYAGTVVANATASGAGAFTAGTDDVHQITAQNGYGNPNGTSLCGNNNPGPHGSWAAGVSGQTAGSTVSWTFPQPGIYAGEIDYANFNAGGLFNLLSPGNIGPSSASNPTQQSAWLAGTYNQVAVGEPASGTQTPSWQPFTTGGSTGFVNGQVKWGSSATDELSTAQIFTWNNIGPVTEFSGAAGWGMTTNFTLPGTIIVDTNDNLEFPIQTGYTGVGGTTTWSATVGAVTNDANFPTLQWLNEGSAGGSANTPTTGLQAATGFFYWIALVNTLDNTVSNLGPISINTEALINGQVTFPAGSGLNINNIDPQADYVAIFRTTDGFTTPFLVPGFANSPYTVPLTQYLRYGYVDTVPDAELDDLLEGAENLENTPPASGAINLTYHLNRIWYSIGNIVYWTTGPLSPIGNGTDGTAPGNTASCPSLVKRLVPTAIGMLVFTLSDIYIIPGSGTANSPILPAIPYLTGVGLGSYNALDINGGIIGFFTTDSQFVIFDPSAGLSYVGFNIGDQFRQNNGSPGTSWNSSKVYVAWYISGEDQGWYVADGVNGWFRMIATPSPEQGNVAWSPFATIQGTAGAIASIETSPGVHNLLIGQTSSDGNIVTRSLAATTDNGSTGSNGTTYLAYGVIGSIILANPGQIAKVAFITTVSVRVGSPLILGVALNEALPYFTGSFDILKERTNDPPNIPEGSSFYRERFYLSEDHQSTAYVTDLQVLFQWPPEAAANELQTMTLFGAYEIEQ